jgi:NAD(P)-dependent dehydrogenase (short-subunit alcohol dehydrogenase family)
MPVALITGGASLIGRSAAKKLLAEGWNVVLADIDKKTLDAAASELGGANAVATEIVDVTDLDAINRVIAAIVKKHGALDGMVTCAGGLRGLGYEAKPFLEISPQEWYHTVEVNLIGLMNCCYAAIPVMKKAKKGAIVNITAGLTGAKDKSIYSAAKAGANRFFQAIAAENAAHGIRINSVFPGSVPARWRKPGTQPVNVSPLGYETTPDEVGDAIAFLMSEDADHITGTVLDVSGGTALY